MICSTSFFTDQHHSIDWYVLSEKKIQEKCKRNEHRFSVYRFKPNNKENDAKSWKIGWNVWTRVFSRRHSLPECVYMFWAKHNNIAPTTHHFWFSKFSFCHWMRYVCSKYAMNSLKYKFSWCFPSFEQTYIYEWCVYVNQHLIHPRLNKRSEVSVFQIHGWCEWII